jgi:hypothetical protein
LDETQGEVLDTMRETMKAGVEREIKKLQVKQRVKG